MYVVLSRVASPGALQLTVKIKVDSFRLYPREIQEHHRMPTERYLLPLNLPSISNKSFIVTLLNVKSQQTFNWYIMWQKNTRGRYFMPHRNLNFAVSEHRKNIRILSGFFYIY